MEIYVRGLVNINHTEARDSYVNRALLVYVLDCVLDSTGVLPEDFHE